MGLVGRLHCCKHRHCVFCGVYPRNACSACNIINTLLRCIFEEIAEAVKTQMNLSVDKKKIQIKEGIKTLGTHMVSVKLHPEVTAELKVVVKEEA